LTQEDVAERVGIATEVYGRIERGRMLPSVPTLRRVCLILRTDPGVLLGLAGDAASTPPEQDSRQREEPRDVRALLRLIRRMSRRRRAALAQVARILSLNRSRLARERAAVPRA
jgi:transcriptional regulator with XRE-family HTH domain